MNKEELLETGRRYSMKTFDRKDRIMVDGQGSYIKDIDGKEYLDFLSGIAVNALGHNHPHLVDGICDQSQKIIHSSNLVWYEPSIIASKRLVEASVLDKIFFSNSGAEANEGAIKLARKYGEETKGEGAIEIITMKQSFHGRTMATLKATGQEPLHQSFGPHLPGFKYAEFNNSEALKEAIDNKTCAIMLELVQGEGGINLASDEFIQTIKDLKDQHDLLIIIDEIQTGIGRTGTFFAYEQFDIEPDIISLAKGIGGGLATGAFMAKEEVAKHFDVGDHGTTFGGNPLATVGINAVLDVIEGDDLLTNVKDRGQQLADGLQNLVDKYESLEEVKGLGLLCGVTYQGDLPGLLDALYEGGLLATSSKGNVLRLLPSLNVSEDEVEECLSIIDQTLDQIS